MGSWADDRTGCEYEWCDQEFTVDVTDNPIVAELLDADGNVIRQWRERRPIGFR